MSIQNFFKALEKAESIGITAPSPPDGDSVGAQCALVEILEQRFPNKSIRIINEDPCPKRYRFLNYADRFEVSDQITTGVDAFLCVDGGPERIGEKTTEFWKKASIKGLIDHHVVGSSENFDIKIYDPNAAATTQLVHRLIKEHQIDMSSSMAQAIYVGLIFDTGLFKHSNTTPEIMRIGAELLEKGFDHTDTAEKALLLRTPSNIKLLSKLLSSYNLEKGISWGKLDLEAMKGCGGPDDKDGLIDALFLVPECKVAVLFSEKEKDIWKLSFRSRGIDVANIARGLNPDGGGHKLAAGCTINGTFEEIHSKAIGALSQELSHA